MFRKTLLVFTLLAFTAALLLLAAPAQATPAPQAFYYTPTPGLDGRILYVVKKNDTCLSISLLTGVSLDQIIQLNKLDANCTLVERQELLLGVFQTPTPTPGPSPTPTPVTPTPTPFNGNGKICVYLFDDVNGDGIPGGGENPIAGGAISITERKTSNSMTGSTVGAVEPVCFENLPEGDYNISVAPPQGYNPTTNMNYPLTLVAGDESIIDFGAQASSSAAPAPVSEGGGRSPLLAIVGGLLVVAGIGMGVYFTILRRQSGSLP